MTEEQLEQLGKVYQDHVNKLEAELALLRGQLCRSAKRESACRGGMAAVFDQLLVVMGCYGDEDCDA